LKTIRTRITCHWNCKFTSRTLLTLESDRSNTYRISRV